MKAKYIFAVSLLAAGAAFADTTEVETSYVMGVFPLTVGKQAIINIPWIEAGADASSASATIAVTNLIKTATLKQGDQLFYYDGSGYKAWYVDGADDSLKVWKPYSEATTSGGVSVGTPGDLRVLERGRALILNRAASYSDNSTTNVYIVGQYTSAAAPTISIGNGYTLLAPPVVTNVNLVAYNWSGAHNGDQLIVGVTNRYIRKNGAWGQRKYDASTYAWSFEEKETITLPAGTGLFYYNTGDQFNFGW